MSDAVRLSRLLNGYRVTQAIHVAAVLGVSDLLADGPLSVSELADRAGAHPHTLYRLMRALESLGLYEELPEQRFSLTPMGQALCADAPEPVGAWAAYIGRQAHWQAWSALLHSVRTGENAFESVFGEDVWSYRRSHPDESAAFDAAMTGGSTSVARGILDAYDFGRFSVVADIGGGHGGLLAAILERHPSMRGILFDQPHVVTGAADLLGAAGVADRCEVRGGSFFDRVPAGADAYLLKYVVHDWDDVQAAAILAVCRRDMSEDAALLLVERILPGPGAGDRGARQDTALADLNMLVGPGGEERTIGEFEALLDGAGLSVTRVVPTAREISVIEARPR
jgi:hypothetical protein